MKKLLLMFAVAGLCAASASAQQSSYPSGATILPTPDSRVDVSPNKFPLGVSAISFQFSGQDVAKNDNNTKPAELYYEDFTKPACTTLTVSIDMETWKTAGVIFPGTWSKNGKYKIFIPSGMFSYGGTPNPDMTLYYEINVGWYATPVDQLVVTDLQEIVLTFPDATNVEFTSGNRTTFGTRDTSYGFSQSIEGNRVIYRMSQGGVGVGLTTPGQYMLHVESGSIAFVQNGENRTNDEIRLTYHIPEAPEPNVWPFADEVVTEGLEYFEVTPPGGFENSPFFLMNNQASNALYRADADTGEVDKSYTIAVVKVLLGECDFENRRMYLALYDPLTMEPLNFELVTEDEDGNWIPMDEWYVKPGSLKSWKPEVTGSYCLMLAQGLYSGEYTSIVSGSAPKFITSSPYRFYYDIEGTDLSEVKDGEIVIPDYSVVNAYSLTGIRVIKNGTLDDVKNLPAGFYVVNGKKIVVK